MKIIGTDGLTHDQVNEEIKRGGKFVIYQYCISILVMTFKRSSSIYFIKSGESAVKKGLGFTALSMVAGWWGIPWGPIYTVQVLAKNLGGGHDVTRELLAQSNGSSGAAIPQARG